MPGTAGTPKMIETPGAERMSTVVGTAATTETLATAKTPKTPAETTITGVRHSTAPSYPSIENSFNGC
jgi:hypothetical protein